jgi:hypothetical protein
MSKPTFVISCPIDTYSGYGARSRDIVKAIIELDKYEVKVLPQRWGNTPIWIYSKQSRMGIFNTPHSSKTHNYQHNPKFGCRLQCQTNSNQ